MALELDVGECLTWKSCGEQGHIARKVFQGRVVFSPHLSFFVKFSFQWDPGKSLGHKRIFGVFRPHGGCKRSISVKQSKI